MKLDYLYIWFINSKDTFSKTFCLFYFCLTLNDILIIYAIINILIN